MGGRQRLLAALDGRPGDVVPAAPLYPFLYVAAEERRVRATAYRELVSEGGTRPLDPEEDAAIRAHAACRAWQAFGEPPDWILPGEMPAAEWLGRCQLRRQAGHVYLEHPASGWRDDLTGVPENSFTEDLWQRPWPGSRAEIDAQVPVATAEQWLADGRLAVYRPLRAEIGDRAAVCGFLNGPFWLCYYLLGFEGLMVMPRLEPVLFHYLMQRQTDAALAKARSLAAAGVDCLFVEECLTSADMLSPEQYDELVLPYSRQLFAEVHRLGLPSVLYYCGDVMPRLERLVELGPSALAVEESKKGFTIDLAAVAAGVGKSMALFGNIDVCRFAAWSDEELQRQLAQQQLAARPARAFIASIGSPFTPETPLERMSAFNAAAHRLIPAREPMVR